MRKLVRSQEQGVLGQEKEKELVREKRDRKLEESSKTK
ncbi:hypothetical protein A2U01_0073885, partial [Trifolium medium]|nr:hypothetical protein [Trifolium medium]